MEGIRALREARGDLEGYMGSIETGMGWEDGGRDVWEGRRCREEEEEGMG